MTAINQKKEIVQSLSTLDAVQSEKVLEYIKTLLDRRQDETNDDRRKGEILKEINRALGQARLWI
ncbi:MAG TPA: hypothetical protein VFO54_07230 [Chryseosolibacter sp.]|nr:hypothetical protein [Chryseosolibacter sp.]